MGGLDPNIGGDRKNPFKDLEIQQAINDEESKNKKLFSKNNNNPLNAIVINAMQTIVHLFTSKARSTISNAEKAFIDEDIEFFKEALIKLKQEDLSQNIYFLKELSKSWHDITHHFAILYPNKNSTIYQKIHHLMGLINSYPEGEENTMGFYLSHFAGQDWIPFPYMEILQNLHQEKNNTHLENWISLLDEIEIEIKPKK